MNHPSGSEAAFYQGLREFRDIDPEVAEDLGVPMSDESFERHVESGQEVGRLMARTAVDGAAEHAAVEAKEGRVTCASCFRPGCPGCGKS